MDHIKICYINISDNENCALLGCYVASSTDVSEQPTGPIFKGQDSNFLDSLLNDSEERSSYPVCVGSLQSHIASDINWKYSAIFSDLSLLYIYIYIYIFFFCEM
jgi:hypothetical protein